MVMFLLIAAYLIGYVTCYFAFRAIVKAKFNRNWLLMEKTIVIALSLFSWAAILTFSLLMITAFIFSIDFDKEIKW